MKVTVNEIIVKSSEKGLSTQNANGSMPTGHNGPWNDNDTPVRTTAHWAIAFLHSYKVTGNKKFLNGVERCCNYLLSEDVRPYNSTFYCRKSPKMFRKNNGLIGQIWAIEALITIGKYLNYEKVINLAKDVLKIHPYCYEKHGWKNVKINGEIDKFNYTFNQQVWFASFAISLECNDQLKSEADDFFRNLKNNTVQKRNGLIRHENYRKLNWGIKEIVKPIIKPAKIIKRELKIHELSNGYLTFILYGLANAIEETPEYTVWRTKYFSQLINTACQYVKNNLVEVEGSNKFCWSYNPTGFEFAYSLQVFNQYIDGFESSDAEIKFWINLQLKNFYNFENNLLEKNTTDPIILSSRIYELCRLKNYQLDI